MSSSDRPLGTAGVIDLLHGGRAHLDRDDPVAQVRLDAVAEPSMAMLASARHNGAFGKWYPPMRRS